MKPMNNKESTPRVSIGLPVYNGARYVSECISSILGQTFEDFELIICDNASTDETEEICRRFAEQDHRVRYYRNERNLGAAPNFNLTFEKARGEYFKWAAHDDICLPDYLAECVRVLDSDETVVLCTVQTEWIDADGSRTAKLDETLKCFGAREQEDRLEELLFKNHWWTDVFGLVRRSVLAKTDLLGSYSASDCVLMADLVLRGRFYRVPRALFLLRDHAARSSRSLNMWQRAVWFNTANHWRFQFPYWRLVREYLKVVFRVPLPPRVRWICFWKIFRWSMVNHRRLLGDIKKMLLSLSLKSGKPNARPIRT